MCRYHENEGAPAAGLSAVKTMFGIEYAVVQYTNMKERVVPLLRAMQCERFRNRVVNPFKPLPRPSRQVIDLTAEDNDIIDLTQDDDEESFTTPLPLRPRRKSRFLRKRKRRVPSDMPALVPHPAVRMQLAHRARAPLLHLDCDDMPPLEHVAYKPLELPVQRTLFDLPNSLFDPCI